MIADAEHEATATAEPATQPGDSSASRSSSGVAAESAPLAAKPRMLVRSGRLVFDGSRLSRVQARFAGQVLSIGQTQTDAPADQVRPLRFGDSVKQGQVLAVIWSGELAEKKSELLSALAQLELDRRQVARLGAAQRGSEELQLKSEAEQRLKAAHLTVARLEDTLHSWHIGEEAIEEVRSEARRMGQQRSPKNTARAREWAEMPVRSPIDGVVLERSVNVGEGVDPQHDLFKICDVSTLGVTIDAYEEDLPALQSLTPEARHWTVRLKSEPAMTGIEGSFDVISHVVDPRIHTIPVRGTIDNHEHLLRAGQFVTAEIPLP